MTVMRKKFAQTYKYMILFITNFQHKSTYVCSDLLKSFRNMQSDKQKDNFELQHIWMLPSGFGPNLGLE